MSRALSHACRYVAQIAALPASSALRLARHQAAALGTSHGRHARWGQRNLAAGRGVKSDFCSALQRRTEAVDAHNHITDRQAAVKLAADRWKPWHKLLTVSDEEVTVRNKPVNLSD